MHEKLTPERAPRAEGRPEVSPEQMEADLDASLEAAKKHAAGEVSDTFWGDTKQWLYDFTHETARSPRYPYEEVEMGWRKPTLPDAAEALKATAIYAGKTAWRGAKGLFELASRLAGKGKGKE